jgi:hypothetical protein
MRSSMKAGALGSHERAHRTLCARRLDGGHDATAGRGRLGRPFSSCLYGLHHAKRAKIAKRADRHEIPNPLIFPVQSFAHFSLLA